MSNSELPEWERVLSAAARLQEILPDAVLVGGTAAAIYAGHRLSRDADHVPVDLRSRFDNILSELESHLRQERRLMRPLPPMVVVLIASLQCLFVAAASAASLTIKLPAGMVAEKATATTEKLPKTTLDGVVAADTVTFTDPLPGSAYEVALTLKDGTILQGVDMGWYSMVPDKKNAEELNEDDRQQMNDVLKKVLSFYNLSDVVLLKGNHNRAVMLVQLVRDKPFHSDKDDSEVIWRPELWYFQNNHGGWEKVQQTDRVLRRERYANHKEYHAVLDVTKWTPELGGLKSTPRNPDVRVQLPANAGVTTPPPGGAAVKGTDAGEQ